MASEGREAVDAVRKMIRTRLRAEGRITAIFVGLVVTTALALMAV